MMNCTFERTVVTRLHGASAETGASERVVELDAGAMHLSFVVTSDPEPWLAHSDRELALRECCLNASLRKPEEIAKAVNAVKTRRINALDSDPALVVQLSGPAELNLSKPHSDQPEFIFGFELASKRAYRDKTDAVHHGILASLLASSSHLRRLTKIADSVYFFREDGHPIYVSNSTVSATLGVSQSWTPETHASFCSLAKKGIAVPEFSSTLRLYASTASEATDPLRRFFRAWTAVETLICVFFKRNLERLIESSDLPQIVVDVKSAVQKRDREIFTLNDKFSVVAAYLRPKSTLMDVEEFKSLKKVRDEFSHGKFVAEDDLPCARAENLMQAYVKAWLEWSEDA